MPAVGVGAPLRTSPFVLNPGIQSVHGFTDALVALGRTAHGDALRAFADGYPVVVIHGGERDVLATTDAVDRAGRRVTGAV